MYAIKKIVIKSLVAIGIVTLLTGCGATLVNSIQKDSLTETNKLLDERIAENRYKRDDFGSARNGKDFLSIAIDKGYEDLAIKVIQKKIMSSKGGYSFGKKEYRKSIISKAISQKMLKLVKVLHKNGWIGSRDRNGNFTMSISINDYNKLKKDGNQEIANYFFTDINDFKYNIESKYSLDKGKANNFTKTIELVLNNKIMNFEDFAEKIISQNISTGFSRDENLIVVIIQHLLKNGYKKEAITVANLANKYDKEAKYYDIQKMFLKPFINNLEVFNVFYTYYTNPKRDRHNYSGQSAGSDIGLEASIINNSLEPIEIYEKNHGVDGLSHFLDREQLLQSIKDRKFIVINYLLNKDIDFSEAEKTLTAIINTKDEKLLSKIDRIKKLPDTFIALKESGVSFSEIPNWLNAKFSLEESALWIKSGFNLETAKIWNQQIPPLTLFTKPIFIIGLGLYKKMGITNPERAMIYLQYKISEKKVMKIDRSITKQCGNTVLGYTKLKEMNPYEAKNKCFWFEGRRYNTISKSRGLYSYNNVYVDINFKDYAEGSFVGVVKGTGVTDLQDGSKIPETKVVQVLK